jgi:protein subunit release factor B
MTDMFHRLHISRWLTASTARPFTSSATLGTKHLPPRPVIVEQDIEESFLKGSGPGGQKIVRPSTCIGIGRIEVLTELLVQNKTSSAVQLKHIPTGIVVKSQETRSRQQNRKLARQLLADKLDLLEKGEKSRVAIKTREAAKKRASKLKKTRRKYKKLEEEKEVALPKEPEMDQSKNPHEKTPACPEERNPPSIDGT